MEWRKRLVGIKPTNQPAATGEKIGLVLCRGSAPTQGTLTTRPEVDCYSYFKYSQQIPVVVIRVVSRPPDTRIRHKV